MLEGGVVEASMFFESRHFTEIMKDLCGAPQLPAAGVPPRYQALSEPSTHSNVEPRELGDDTNCGCSTWTCTLVGTILPSS
jgi:hypothetical protein